MSEPEFRKLRLDNIEATAATQVRVRLDRGIIDQYTQDVKDGAAFPPIDVYCEPNSERYILADGFHRHRAFVNAEREEIGCYIHEGGLKEALIHALGANSEHGHRRSNADKRHAVEMALKDPEISQLQQQEIADICRVHTRTVRRIQNDILSKDSSNGDDRTKSGDDDAPETHKPEDHTRDSGDVSQQQVETDELRQALKMITVLPYPGEDAPERLLLDDDLISDAEHVSVWLASLVLQARKNHEEESNGDGNAAD